MTTVAPLASDPAIQQAIADDVTAQVLTYLDVPGLTNQVVDALAERGLTRLLATQLRTLSGPIASGVEGFTHDQVVRVVQSDAIGWGADRAGLPTGRFGVWVEANKRALQVGAIILACLALVCWSQPTGKVVLGLTLALLVVLALIEFLGRRPADAPVEAQAPVE